MAETVGPAPVPSSSAPVPIPAVSVSLTASPAPAAVPPTAVVVDLRDAGVSVRESVRARAWSVSGDARVLGPVEVDGAELAGRVSIGGPFAADQLRLSGFLAVLGPARIRSRAELRGESRWSAGLTAAELEVTGTMVSGAPLAVDGLAHVRGTLEVSGAARVGRLVLEGALTVAGPIEAREATVRLLRPSRAQSIRAQEVRVTVRRGLPIPGTTHPSLVVDRIDARVAELEGVSCEYLRAERIALGRDCHIARLDGTVVARHPSARVGPESRSPTPHGLTR